MIIRVVWSENWFCGSARITSKIHERPPLLPEKKSFLSKPLKIITGSTFCPSSMQPNIPETLFFSRTEKLSRQELPIDHKRVSHPFGKHGCYQNRIHKDSGFRKLHCLHLSAKRFHELLQCPSKYWTRQ